MCFKLWLLWTTKNVFDPIKAVGRDMAKMQSCQSVVYYVVITSWSFNFVLWSVSLSVSSNLFSPKLSGIFRTKVLLMRGAEWSEHRRTGSDKASLRCACACVPWSWKDARIAEAAPLRMMHTERVQSFLIDEVFINESSLNNQNKSFDYDCWSCDFPARDLWVSWQGKKEE